MGKNKSADRSFMKRVAFAFVAFVIVTGFLFSAFVMSRIALRNLNVERVRAAAPQSSARAMCTIEASTGRVLYSKNKDARLAMASTTKIVTAITAIEAAAEKGLDLDAKFKVSDKAIGIEGTSIYLQKGEELSMRELLYGLMLRSGNDAATAIALGLYPTVSEFCAKMEEVARKCGAVDSGFKNPHGLDAEGHFTTAHDLAKISAYALKNPVFAEVVKTTDTKISGAQYPRALQNKNRLLRTLDGCVGVKTGFTKKAGRCYVGAREDNGMTVVCVVLNCGPMFEEAAEYLTLAGEEFEMRKVLSADDFVPASVSGGAVCGEACLQEDNGERCGDEKREASGEKASDDKTCDDGACGDNVRGNVDGKSGSCMAPACSAPRAIACENFFYPLCDSDDVRIDLQDEFACVYVNNKLIYKSECNIIGQ